MPAVAREGDAEIVHCSTPYRDGHFGSVYANGIAMSGVGHLNTIHLKPCKCPPCCCPHTAPIAAGSSTVKVNGLGAGRIGDGIIACTMVAVGSPNVMAGG
mgnify:CR=1 FL=1